MDHDALAALFRRIVLASAPLLAGGCFIGEDHQCNSPEKELTTPAMIETDAAPPDASVTDLCRQALPQPDSYLIKTCELVAADGGQAVHVRL